MEDSAKEQQLIKEQNEMERMNKDKINEMINAHEIEK